jgi:capsid protein
MSLYSQETKMESAIRDFIAMSQAEVMTEFDALITTLERTVKENRELLTRALDNPPTHQRYKNSQVLMQQLHLHKQLLNSVKGLRTRAKNSQRDTAPRVAWLFEE